MTRWDFRASLSFNISPKIGGTICHDTPYLCFSQPHLCFFPAGGKFLPQIVYFCLRLTPQHRRLPHRDAVGQLRHADFSIDRFRKRKRACRRFQSGRSSSSIELFGEKVTAGGASEGEVGAGLRGVSEAGLVVKQLGSWRRRSQISAKNRAAWSGGDSAARGISRSGYTCRITWDLRNQLYHTGPEIGLANIDHLMLPEIF